MDLWASKDKSIEKEVAEKQKEIEAAETVSSDLCNIGILGGGGIIYFQPFFLNL